MRRQSARLRVPAAARMLAAAGLMLATGCGGSSSPSGPTPPGGSGTITLQSGRAPGGGGSDLGGDVVGGFVTLSSAAPSGGRAVQLSSNNPAAASVPVSVLVPAGATSANVPVQTHAIPAPANVTITASAAGGSATLPVPVSAATTLFAYASTADADIGQGWSRRYTPDSAGFTATVDTSLNFVTIVVRPRGQAEGWTIVMAAPAGSELRPGSYANALGGSSARLSFSGFARSCNANAATFTVTDVVYSAASVERLHATFSQDCSNGARPAETGEIRIER